ncbi:MAG: YlbF family regulator [Archaeoglobaceae archaeon]
MLSDVVREKALELAEEIKSLAEYREFLECERELKEDIVAQELLLDFQKKQQEFVVKQMSGEFDQNLMNELTEIQAKLNARESVVKFIESYNRLLAVIGELMDLISEKIELDIGEVYRR